MSHSSTFNAAFSDPKNTAITTADSHVNQVIRDNYSVDKPFTYTRTMLWDMEVKKAHSPDIYIQHVVRPGSLKTFDHVVKGSLEYFVRISDQKMWKDPSQYTTVVENVCLDHDNHSAIFLGMEEATNPEDGKRYTAGAGQPIFHVEHSVIGSEDAPVNTWRIVHLTERRDGAMDEVFDKIGNTPFLRLFNEVYIRRDLGRELVRKELAQ